MKRWRMLTACAAVLGCAMVVGGASAHSDGRTTGTHAPNARLNGFDLEAHRGGRGLRPENTLAAFGKAMQIGVTTLELDTGVTQDGVVVVSHERRLSSLECRDTAAATPGDPEYPYIGKLIKDLTYAQIATLDCGVRTPPNPATDPFLPTMEAVPGTRMPRLEEVFALAKRYGARVGFNIETKIDPTVPDDTVAPGPFTSAVVRAIRDAGMTHRSLLQSFDWRTLVVAGEIAPRLRTVALAQLTTIQPGVAGPSPWTAGVDVDRVWGNVARAAASLGIDVLSPNYGQGTYGTASWVPYMTDRMVAEAHYRRMPVIPWTINDPVAMDEAIDRGVDGIISDYPDILRTVAAANGLRLRRGIEAPFDIQGHRGAKAARPENTLAAFSYALDAGVDTLELDTGITQDGAVIVLHDRKINGVHCADTAPATAGDPEYPYVGDLVKDLTLAQVKTLDCGKTDPGFPAQVPVPGERIPTLQEVFDLVIDRGDLRTRFNIETKIGPLTSDTVPYDEFTERLVAAIKHAGMDSRTTIQSFDWRTIILSRQLAPQIETVALVWQFAGADCDNVDDECSLEAVVGDPTVQSPWTGGLDWWDYRDLGALVRAVGASVVSSNWQVHDPSQGNVASSDWYLKEDPSIFHGPDVAGLHAQGLAVIPYTLDHEPIIQRVIDLGVDGIISDDVDLLILVAKRNGLE